MLTRYKGALKLKEWAFAVAKRSTMRKARIALARRLAIIMHAMLRHGTEFRLYRRGRARSAAGEQEAETSSRAEYRPREGVGDGAVSVACGQSDRPTAVSTKLPY